MHKGPGHLSVLRTELRPSQGEGLIAQVLMAETSFGDAGALFTGKKIQVTRELPLLASSSLCVISMKQCDRWLILGQGVQ